MITIISPVFQAEKFLANCIENVASQIKPGMEHLIIDGGSSDKTVEILSEMSVKYTHLKWISEKDEGQSDAMNKGLKMAKNQVVSFLNADDYYEPGALEFAVTFFEKAPPHSFLVGNCRVLKEDGSEYMINKPWPFNPVNFRLDFNFPFNPSAYFYHRSIHELVGYYDENDHLTMDIDFILRLIPMANIAYKDRVLGNYVMVTNSKTMLEISSGRNLNNLNRIFQKHENKLTVIQHVQYRFQKGLGKNRGWIMYYLNHPGAFFRKLFSKSAKH